MTSLAPPQQDGAMDGADGKPPNLPKGAQIGRRVPFQARPADDEPKRSPVWSPRVVPASSKARRIFVLAVGRLQRLERHRAQARDFDTGPLADSGKVPWVRPVPPDGSSGAIIDAKSLTC